MKVASGVEVPKTTDTVFRYHQGGTNAVPACTLTIFNGENPTNYSRRVSLSPMYVQNSRRVKTKNSNAALWATQHAPYTVLQLHNSNSNIS